jgi:hypothetical protein
MEYHRTNPEEGSYLVAKKMDLPRGRVHKWLEGSQPDPVRALDVAEANGWLDATWSSDIGRAFNILVATIFSSGSLGTRDLTPLFSVDADEHAAFIRASLAAVGCGAVIQRTDDPSRTNELLPEKHTAVLGRALAVLGAPIGTKNDQAEISLPEYLRSAPESTRKEFVEVYVAFRGYRPDHIDGRLLSESRSDSFHRSLAELIESVTNVSINPSVGKQSLYVPAEAVSELDLSVSWE